MKAVGDVRLLEGYWQPTDRAARLRHLLAQRDDWTLEALKAVQNDVTAHAAPKVVEHLVALLTPARAALNEREQAALNLLKNWDGEHGTDSAAAAVYQVLTDYVLRNMLLDDMGEALFASYGSVADHWNAFKYLIQTPDFPLWDNQETAQEETAEDIVAASLRDTVRYLVEACGPEPEDWAWGALHTMEFKHPFGYLPGPGFLFNIGPFPAPGGAEIVNNMLYSKGALNFDVLAGPSTRRLMDFGDITHSYTILPTGNSGNFLSPHYSDQAEMFMAGEYRLVRFTPEQIRENTQQILELRPATRAE
jgi:penicillin amidase